MGFFKRELSLAQARIVAQDAEISDKSKRVDILLTQLKSYEERENNSLYDQYFPNNTDPNVRRCSAQNSCTSHRPQTHGRHPCYCDCFDHDRRHCHSNLPSCSQHASIQVLKDEIIQAVRNLQADHVDIKKATISISEALTALSSPSVKESSQQHATNQPTEDVLLEDLSINSIDYLIPDDPTAQSQELNLNS